jgi:hypothetical protein
MKPIQQSLLFLIATLLATSARATEFATDQTRPNTPPYPGAFMALRPGQIEPEGWLRDWAMAARNGLTGHMEEIIPPEWAKVIELGWSGQDAYPGTKEKRTSLYTGEGWQTEQSAYAYDGMVRLALVLHDEALLAKAHGYLQPVIDNAKADGNGFLHWIDDGVVSPDKKGFSFEQWGQAVLGRALVAYYAGTGDPAALAAIERAYAPENAKFSFGGLGRQGINNEVMLEAWELGGANFLRDRVLASGFPNNLKKASGEWVAGEIKPDHGVSFNEASKLPAELFPYIGKPELLAGSAARFRWTDRFFGQPHGGIDSDEHMRGINAFSGTETCDVTDGLYANAIIGMVSGECIYGDRIERLFFNAGPSAVSRDYKAHVYFQSPNRLDSGVDGFSTGAPWWFDYAPVHSPFCCTVNLTRQIPNYVINMWADSRDGGLVAFLYGPNKVTAKAGGTQVVVKTETDYPFGEQIVFHVDPAQPAKFPLHFRIPAWCESATFSMNGQSTPAAPNEKGFATIDRIWKAGDTLTLNLPMQPRLLTGRECFVEVDGGKKIAEGNDFNIAQNEAALAGTKGINVHTYGPYGSILYGPLLMVLPVPEVSANESKLNDADWRVALAIPSAEALAQARVERTPPAHPYDWPYAAPLRLIVPVAEAPAWQPEKWTKTTKDSVPYKNQTGRLPLAPVTDGSAHEAVFIPYGNTKFRVSMFPITESTARWALHDASK